MINIAFIYVMITNSFAYSNHILTIVSKQTFVLMTFGKFFTEPDHCENILPFSSGVFLFNIDNCAIYPGAPPIIFVVISFFVMLVSVWETF